MKAATSNIPDAAIRLVCLIQRRIVCQPKTVHTGRHTAAGKSAVCDPIDTVQYFSYTLAGRKKCTIPRTLLTVPSLRVTGNSQDDRGDNLFTLQVLSQEAALLKS